VKPQSYKIGEKVLVYDPKKRRGRFAKWDVRWVGPFVIENKLNSANYVIKKGRGKPVVIHVDRLRKLPTEIDIGDINGLASDVPATSPPAKRCKSDTAAETTDMPVAAADAAAAATAADSLSRSPPARPSPSLNDCRRGRDNNAASHRDGLAADDEYQPVSTSRGSDAAPAAATVTAGASAGSPKRHPIPSPHVLCASDVVPRVSWTRSRRAS